ncbi:MAG: TonB family protein [Nitrospirota bacterium]
MVVLSATLHVVFAVALVWGPSWIKPRQIAPAYEVQLVSLPVDEVPKPKPERAPARPEPRKPPPPPVKPKPAPVKKAAPPPVEKAKPSVKPAPADIPEEPEEAPEPDPPTPEPPAPVAKATEPAEPGIQLVTPLMEAVALKYPYYMNALKRKINENWSPPGAGFAEAREVLVVFIILRDGSVRGAEVEQSSGDVFYDQAALRSVLRATPFPPLPDGYPGQDMKIHFSFLLDPDRMS